MSTSDSTPIEIIVTSEFPAQVPVAAPSTSAAESVSEPDICECPLCAVRRRISKEKAEKPTVGMKYPPGLAAFLAGVEVPNPSAYDSFVAGLGRYPPSEQTSTQESETATKICIQMPNGGKKVFSSVAEFAIFMTNYRDEEDVPEDSRICADSRCGRCAILRFEENEIIRREKAQRKFEARQAAKTEKRRAKFFRENGRYIDANSCRIGGRRNRK